MLEDSATKMVQPSASTDREEMKEAPIIEEKDKIEKKQE